MTITAALDSYTTTSAQGLRFDSVPMRLFQKAKILEHDFLLRLLSQFQAGDEAVTLDLLPLIYAVGHDGQVEEEIYLTSFLWASRRDHRGTSVAYGFGAALTLDEFALWLSLSDVYWEHDGRAPRP